MSERLPQCPICKLYGATTVKIHNPDTHDMNAKATLKCWHCEYEYEGLVASPYTEERRSNGLII